MQVFDSIDFDDVLQWARTCENDPQYLINRGHQAEVYHYCRHGNAGSDGRDGRSLVVKVAYGKGMAAKLRRHMLRNEARAYRRLAHVDALPACFGLIDGKYLLLEYLDSVSYRHCRLADRDRFFQRLREQIDAIHAAGVAHGDLKTRSNIMVTSDGQPHIVDFGIAIVRKPGFAPLNHWLFDRFVQFDRNAWIKLKYKGRLHEIATEDRAYYRTTFIERLARIVRRAVRRLKT